MRLALPWPVVSDNAQPDSFEDQVQQNFEAIKAGHALPWLHFPGTFDPDSFQGRAQANFIAYARGERVLPWDLLLDDPPDLDGFESRVQQNMDALSKALKVS